MDPVTGQLLTLVLLAVTLAVLGLVSARLRRAKREIELLREGLTDRRVPGALVKTGRAVKVVTEAAARVRNQGVSGFLFSSAEDLTRWVLDDRLGIVRMAGSDGTVTIFFSDIESSTATNERIGDKAWVSLLAKHDAVVRAEVEKQRGHVVKSQGDGFMIVFRYADAAVQAGIAIQEVLGAGRGRRLSRNPIRVRMGMHTGTVIAKEGDYFGLNVAMAARVAALADGSEILVSDATRQRLGETIQVTELEDVELKGLQGDHTLWRVNY